MKWTPGSILLAAALMWASEALAQGIELIRDRFHRGAAALTIVGDQSTQDPAAPGNRNRSAEPGEVVRLAIGLRNSTDAAITWLLARLRIRDSLAASWAEIVRAEHSYGHLDPGAETPLSTPWTHELRLAPGTPVPGSLPLVLDLFWNEQEVGPQWVEVELPIHAVPGVRLAVEHPESLRAGASAPLQVRIDPPDALTACPRSRLEVIATDPDLTIAPETMADAHLDREHRFTLTASAEPTTREVCVTTRLVATAGSGALYRWSHTVRIALTTAEPRPDWRIRDELGGSLRVEIQGRPLPLPEGDPREWSVPCSPVPRILHILVRAPRESSVPEIEIRQGERRLADGERVIPGAGPLALRWSAEAPRGWSAWLRIGREEVALEIARVPPAMVFVPGGRFTMGQDAGGLRVGLTAHPVVLDDFGIDAFEVTRADYAGFLAAPESRTHARCPSDEPAGKDHAPAGWAGPPGPGESGLPVVGVDWFDARAYAAWADQRLPTEAEWERAACALDRRAFPWGNDWDLARRANVADRHPGPAPVGTWFQDRSAEGAWDLGGNVLEWCSDWADSAAESPAEETNPQGPAKGARRVVRGGAWDRGVTGPIGISRGAADPRARRSDLGFRCVRALPE